MHRANTRTGQHGNRPFKDHRHIDSHAVALIDAQFFQHIGKYLYIFVQFAIGERADNAWFIGFPDKRLCICLSRRDMAIDRIVADVQNAIGKPCDIDRVIAPYTGLLRRGDPVNTLGLFQPETVIIFYRLLVESIIIIWRTMGVFRYRRGDKRFFVMRSVCHESLSKIFCFALSCQQVMRKGNSLFAVITS